MASRSIELERHVFSIQDAARAESPLYAVRQPTSPVTTPPPHHRLAIQGQHAHLDFDLHADLHALWTILFGPSGSGKSTILRALAGLVPHLTTTFNRFDPVTQALQPLAHLAPELRRLAYSPQQALLFPHLTVAENLRFPQSLHHHPSAPQPALPELTHLLHLDSLLPKRAHQLSGGEQQRVALARALAVPGARLLLLDEPFAGLDRALRDDLIPGLQTHLAARGLPVLSVTHDPDEALLLQAEVLRLHNGQLTAHGPARLVLADEIARLARLITPEPSKGARNALP